MSHDGSAQRLAQRHDSQRLVRLALFIFSVLVAVTLRQWMRVGVALLPLSIAGIAVAMWHGALDGVLAEDALKTRYSNRWRAPFLVGYVGLAGAMLMLWWRWPIVALTAFLLYSALHFGTESEQDLSALLLITGFALGAVPIAAACHWSPEQVSAIFSMMLRADRELAAALTHATGQLLWPAVFVALLGAVSPRKEQFAKRFLWVTGALVAAELSLFRFLSPLPAFAIFFCLWHTPEHIASTSMTATGSFSTRIMTDHLRRGVWPWLLSLGAVAAACTSDAHTLTAYAGTLFIALSALTVPHMALAEVCRRMSGETPQEPGRQGVQGAFIR